MLGNFEFKLVEKIFIKDQNYFFVLEGSYLNFQRRLIQVSVVVISLAY